VLLSWCLLHADCWVWQITARFTAVNLPCLACCHFEYSVFVVLLQYAIFIQKFTKSLTWSANRNSGSSSSSSLWLSSNSSIVTSAEFWMKGLWQEPLCLLNAVGRSRSPYFRSVDPNFLVTDGTALNLSKLNACNCRTVAMAKMWR
jgi:hypothetical protein